MKPEYRSVFRNPAHFLAFGFGVGVLPGAPGTYGSLVAIPLVLLLQTQTLWIYALLTVISFVIGIYLCHVTARDLGVHDHPGIVWDEIVGMFISCYALPHGMLTLLAAFVCFRFFDILKPFPIRACDARIQGGCGIMFDDVLAGVYAWCTVQQGALWLLA